jgi:hypothetical protein
MALFGRKKGLTSEVNRTHWAPRVDLNTARPAVFALANTPVSNDMQFHRAIADFVRLSGTPSSEDSYRFAQALLDDPKVTNRPWVWLSAVMREAAAADDNHLAAAGLFWACHWTSNIVPRNNSGGFVQLDLFPIPPETKEELLFLGVASARKLPEDFLIVGDETGQVHAGPLADLAGSQLGL